MNKLGFGLMRLPLTNPDDQTSIDWARLETMVDQFRAAGGTYFDTAWMYHSFSSEPALNRMVVSRFPRDSFTVATKMPVGMISSHEEGVALFARQKEKIGVDYFDYYLVHDMHSGNYERAKQFDMISFLRARQEAGEIRSLGFSAHDNADFLDRVLTECPFFEFVQLQINYLDWDSEGVQSRKCYEVCVKHGKPVTVMEPVKGGTLANIPGNVSELLRACHPDWSPAAWALRFVASLPNVRFILSGMSTPEQMEENTALFSRMEPLNEGEFELLRRAAEMIRGTVAIPCTGCRYCVEQSQCPKNIAIPSYFALYNTEQLSPGKDWSPEKEYYVNFLKQGYGRASDCIACRKCERVCPQHIPISDWMKKVRIPLEDENTML